MDNLITMVVEKGKIFDDWIPIPYPQGLNPENSIFTTLHTENQENVFDIVKSNNDRTKYWVHKLNIDARYTIIFIFFKLF